MGKRAQGRGGQAGVVGKAVRPTYSDEVASRRVNGKPNHRMIRGCEEAQQMLGPSGQSRERPGTSQTDGAADGGQAGCFWGEVGTCFTLPVSAGWMAVD